VTPTTYCEPTVLWRQETRAGSVVEAVAVPTWHACSLVFRVDDGTRRAIDFADLTSAVAYGDEVLGRLERRAGTRPRTPEHD
jgi:hypothetical protein